MTLAKASLEDRLLEGLKKKSLIMPKGLTCRGDLVPLMGVAEARYFDKHYIDPDTPKPLRWAIALCWDGGKIAAYSVVGFGIYRGLESLQQLFK